MRTHHKPRVVTFSLSLVHISCPQGHSLLVHEPVRSKLYCHRKIKDLVAQMYCFTIAKSSHNISVQVNMTQMLNYAIKIQVTRSKFFRFQHCETRKDIVTLVDYLEFIYNFYHNYIYLISSTNYVSVHLSL